MKLDDGLMAAFEPADTRKLYWTKSRSINGLTQDSIDVSPFPISIG